MRQRFPRIIKYQSYKHDLRREFIRKGLRGKEVFFRNKNKLYYIIYISNILKLLQTIYNKTSCYLYVHFAMKWCPHSSSTHKTNLHRITIFNGGLIKILIKCIWLTKLYFRDLHRIAFSISSFQHILSLQIASRNLPFWQQNLGFWTLK